MVSILHQFEFLLIVSLIIITNATKFPANELQALSDLFYSTNGSHWAWRSNYTLNGIPWNFDQPDPNPCTQNWQGLQCYTNCSNHLPCNIGTLLLDSYNLRGQLPTSIGNLARIVYFDVANNMLTGTIPNSIENWLVCAGFYFNNNILSGKFPKTHNNWKQLQIFAISYNQLTGEILSNFINSSQLNYFQAAYNQFTGIIPSTFNSNTLPDLTQFFINNNHFSGPIPTGIFTLPSITYLDLSYNNFNGTIPSNIGQLTSIVALYLDNNQLHGTLPPSIGDCTSLRNLDLSKNHLTGSLPESITSCTLLNLLFVNYNAMNGTIPNGIGQLIHLESLYLFYNFFSGTIPLGLFTIQSLQQLYLRGNRFTGNFFGTITPNTSSIHVLPNLQVLEISYNAFTGSIPSNLGSVWFSQSSLYLLYLCANTFHGTIPSSINSYTGLKYVDISENQFIGSLPHAFLGNSSQLLYLSTNHNHLNGSLPQLGYKPALYTLDYSGNIFSSTIYSMFMMNLPSLQYLYLTNNQLQGPFPSLSTIKPCQILVLNIDSNQFTGPIPHSFYNCSQLIDLNIQNNHFMGTISSNIHQLTSLQVFDCNTNHLYGTLPSDIGKLVTLQEFCTYMNVLTGTLPSSIGELYQLEVLMIYSNMFHGTIPSSFNQLSSLTALVINQNSFTGSLSSDFGFFPNMIMLEVYQNAFTGTLPSSSYWLENMKNCTFLNLEGNWFHGDIQVVQNMIQLEIMNISTNLFSGSLMTTSATDSNGNVFALLVAMQELDLSNNHFTGSINNIFTHMSYLSLLFLHTNQFLGNLNHFTNTSYQSLLSVVDISENAFTGQLPSDVFSSPSLLSFAAVENCLTGSLPILTICNNGSILQTLALDGLHTASSCQLRYFPLLSHHLITSYALTTTLSGGLPSCLFTMRSLQTLHLSGNGITGTIPTITNDLISSSLQDLTLSYNQLSGTIPYMIQSHSWKSLDLSFNKLNGILYSSFATSAASSSSSSSSSLSTNTSSLLLTVNRLSGTIPNTILSSPSSSSSNTVNILKGNIFDCPSNNILQPTSSLPSQDPYAIGYTCGSDSVNVSLYVWLGLVSVIGIIVLICKVFYDKREYNSNSNTWIVTINEWITQLLSWYTIYTLTNTTNTTMYRFGQNMSTLRLLTTYITLITIVVLVPVYVILTVYWSSHTYSYAWSISLAYLTGMTPAMILLVIFIGFYIWLEYIIQVLKPTITTNTTTTNNKDDNGNDDVINIEEGWKTYQESISYNIRSQSIIELTSMKSHHFSTEITPPPPTTTTTINTVVDNPILSSASSLSLSSSPPSPSPQATTATEETASTPQPPPQEETIPKKKKYCWFDVMNSNVWLKCQIVSMNILVVMIVNISYVYITTLNLSSTVMVWVILSISLFKIGWNQMIVLHWCKRYLQRHWKRVSAAALNVAAADASHLQDITAQKEQIDLVYFLIHILLFNNILAPVIADAFVDPSCFYYVIQSPEPVSVQYNDFQCYHIIVHYANITCASQYEVTHTVSYTPPFLYSSQCSSSLLSDFVTVFVYRYLLSGIFGPIANWIWEIYIQPTSLKPKEEENDNDGAQSKPSFVVMTLKSLTNIMLVSDNKERRRKALFDQENFVISIIGDLAVMLTFGLAFPPVAVVIWFSIVTNSFSRQLLIGRYITLAGSPVIGQEQQMEDMNKRVEVEFGDFMKLFWPAIPTLAILSGAFVGFFLFDILGDQIGAIQGIWIFLVMTMVPVWILLVAEGIENRQWLLKFFATLLSGS